MARKTEKVIILGGGVGALSAAVGLVEVNKKRQTHGATEPLYDIHIYQRGWRLGGKCASGRNATFGQRIEEHGLHIWAGFYESAFSIMRTVLADIAPEQGQEDLLYKLFRRQDMVLFRDKGIQSSLACWPLWFEPNENDKMAFPGAQGLFESRPPMPSNITILKRIFDLLYVPFKAMTAHWLASDVAADRVWDTLESDQQNRLREMIKRASSADGESNLMHSLLLQTTDPLTTPPSTMLKDLEVVLGVICWLCRECASRRDKTELSPDLQMINDLIELVGVVILQMIRYAVLSHNGAEIVTDFAKVDHLEIIDFVAENDPHLRNSPVLEAFFDYAFAFRHGATGYPTGVQRPTGSACSVLEGSVQLLAGYREGFFFKGRYGMGDLLCTPIYKYLKKHGVTVHFFHNVTELLPSADGRNVETIHIDQQVAFNEGGYEPQVVVANFKCWPSEPIWDNLPKDTPRNVEYESIYGPQPTPHDQLTLTHGAKGDDGFDHVVFGISAGSLKQLCPKMFDQKIEWQKTIWNLKTTRTKAFQLWFDKDLGELNPDFSLAAGGYKFGCDSDKIGPIVALLPEPFDTYSDMSQTLSQEDWGPNGPKNVAYFCSAMGDESITGIENDPEIAKLAVFAEAIEWFETEGPVLFPGAFDSDGTMKPGSLHLEPKQGDDAFVQQYFRANLDPSERYVLSPPNNLSYRLEAGDTTYDNLTFAGDWTKVANMNAGCVECAAMSGLDAAAAVSHTNVNARNTP